MEEGIHSLCYLLKPLFEWAEKPNSSISTRKSTPGNIHHSDVMMSSVASQITSLTIVYSTTNSGADHSIWSSATLVFVREQRASITENVSIWWRHHDIIFTITRAHSFIGISFVVVISSVVNGLTHCCSVTPYGDTTLPQVMDCCLCNKTDMDTTHQCQNKTKRNISRFVCMYLDNIEQQIC